MTSRSKSFLFSSLLLSFLVLGFSCNESSRGITVSLEGVHEATKDSDGAITNNLGYKITLTQGFVVYSELMLHDCDEVRLMPRMINWISPLSSAYAHSMGSPTVLGTPSVDDLMTEDSTPIDFGVLEPPEGSYCHLMVTLAPADEDAQYLPTGTDMIGRTFFVEGTIEPPGGGPSRAFSAESSAEATVEVHFQDSSSTDAPLELAIENPDQIVTLELNYGLLFEDIDFQTMAADEIEAQVRANLDSALSTQP